ncbi:MAG: transposase domain-containing protein [Verrucomicrobiales bacterium]
MWRRRNGGSGGGRSDREAGPRVAAIASVIESSKRLGINPRDYLADVLPRLANGTTSEVASLTPAAWLSAR